MGNRQILTRNDETVKPMIDLEENYLIQYNKRSYSDMVEGEAKGRLLVYDGIHVRFLIGFPEVSFMY